MAVYVDPLCACVVSDKWPWPKSCHLFADDHRELHRFAARLGLRRTWASDYRQPDSRLLHYDLNESMRRRAVALGAKELDRRESSAKFAVVRAGAQSPPACPRCRSSRGVHAHGDREWWCHQCKGLFDATPGEDTTASDDPTWRIEREESRREKRFGGRR